MDQPIERNEGARRANLNMWQGKIEQELVAIRKLLERIISVIGDPVKR